MPAGIFEHHGFVHHGQLEVGGRIVDRDAAVLGDGDEHEREQRERQRHPQADRRIDHLRGDRGELRGAGQQCHGEHHEQHGGLGERGDQHFAGGADAAERGPDIHPGSAGGERANTAGAFLHGADAVMGGAAS